MNPAASYATAGERFRNILICVLLSFPLLVYAKWMHSALAHEQFTFRRLDLMVLWLAVGYSILSVCWVVLWRKTAGVFVAVVYAAILAAATAETILYFVEKPLTGLPWPPGRIESTAADTMPGITGHRRFTINSYGIRGPEIPLEQTSVRVLCVGGSSVESIQVTDEESWPWLTGTLLSGALGQDVFCGSAGRSGQMALGHAYVLRHYRHAPKFQWIVIMCGINDAGALLWDSYSLRVATVAESTLLGRPFEVDGPYYRVLSSIRLLRSRQRKVNTDISGKWYAQQRAVRLEKLAENTITEPPPELHRALAQYRMDLEAIIEVCRSRNQHLLFLTQPTLYQEGLPEELAALLWETCHKGAYTPGALEKIMAAFNATLISLCKERGIDYLDLAAELPKDTSVFYDDCHFNVEGSRRVAELVSGFLAPRIRSAASSTGSTGGAALR